MGPADIERTLQHLQDRGVRIVDPRQTYVAPEVDLQRVRPGATLHPGARLLGRRTFVGSGAEIGRQGPATVVDSVLGAAAVVDAGYVEGAVLLDGARVGWGAHVRPSTLLEERASTAHCVGLKHTILMPFVTVGSVVNLCDLLIAGGTSEQDHSEVGSGFIHFNFTPWGARGDKATPSLVGDVVHGAFLRERRIFLGGAGGMVGPRRVGYGAITGAGSVLRSDVAAGDLSIQVPRATSRALAPDYVDPGAPRVGRNVEYIAQLVALRQWYRQVRVPREHDADRSAVLSAALDVLDACLAERVQRLHAFAVERGLAMPALELEPPLGAPAALLGAPGPDEHVAWIRGLSEDVVALGVAWLRAVADATAGSAV